MRRYSYLFGLAIAITLTILSSLLIVEAQQKFYGSEPYTPTKLEWLAVELNSVGARDYTAADSYLLKYVPIHNEDAILIFVRYHSQLDREVLNIALDSAREVIRIRSESRGWDKWLKVKEKIERIKT